MTITYYAHNPDADLQNLIHPRNTNVFVDGPPAVAPNWFTTNKYLYMAVAPIVAMHPEWRFVMTSPVKTAETYIFTEVAVFSAGVLLGTVDIVPRGENYVIRVSNDRIKEARVRGSGYRTRNPAKATEEIRRTFYKPTAAEAISRACQTVSNDLYFLDNSADCAYDDARANVMHTVFNYVHSVFGSLPDSIRLDPDVQKAQETHLYLESIRKMRDLWGGKTPGASALLVVLDEGRYIVRSDDEVQIYTPDTVPSHIRMKLGMLKLAEEKQCIDGVGVKVSNEVFVLSPN